MICQLCKIFPVFVTRAGSDNLDVCYPCYQYYVFGSNAGQTQAIKWLEFRRISGEEEEVEQWYKWQNDKELKNTSTPQRHSGGEPF